MLERLLEIDRQVLIYLNNFGSDTYDSFWKTITKFPTWIPLFVLVIVLLFWRESVKTAISKLITYIAVLLVVQSFVTITKNGIGRLRPNNDETINQIIRAVNQSHNFSFFSGHAAFSFCFATMAVLFLKDKIKLIHLIYIFPILFSFSRIYLGVHFPSDIIVGALVGIIFAFLFKGIYNYFSSKFLIN
ncbi:phosphatase PAP2 family protein [Aurantibacter sp.]|uniref:phosphatase PAP2 family protein n=1 Tax=Aurantibacter sp. TaxID=2807103 RepID=UPI0032670856